MFGEMKDFFVLFIQYAINGINDYIKQAVEVLELDMLVSDVIKDLGFIRIKYNIWDLYLIPLTNVLKPFCYCIIAFVLLMELAQTAIKVENIKWEYAIKILIKMVLAKVAIDEAPKLLKAIYMTSVTWVEEIGKRISVADAFSSVFIRNIANKANDLTQWESIAMMTSVSILVLVLRAMTLLLQVMAYARAFELCVLVVISPLPMSFLPMTGGTGNISHITLRYLKNFAAVSLQGVMMVICIKVYQILMRELISQKIDALVRKTGDTPISIIEIMFILLVGMVVLLISITKSGSWAKSVMDAG